MKEKQRIAKRDALKKLKKEIKYYEGACTVLGVACMVISPIEVLKISLIRFIVRTFLSWDGRKAISVFTIAEFTKIYHFYVHSFAE